MSQPTQHRRSASPSTTALDSAFSTLDTTEPTLIYVLSFDQFAHQWESSSGQDDKCHTKPYITITTVVETIKLRRQLGLGNDDSRCCRAVAGY
jgi:hypothetical protein